MISPTAPRDSSATIQQEEDEHVHTLVVQMSTDSSRPEEVARHSREGVARWAQRQPGFVTG